MYKLTDMANNDQPQLNYTATGITKRPAETQSDGVFKRPRPASRPPAAAAGAATPSVSSTSSPTAQPRQPQSPARGALSAETFNERFVPRTLTAKMPENRFSRQHGARLTAAAQPPNIPQLLPSVRPPQTEQQRQVEFSTQLSLGDTLDTVQGIVNEPPGSERDDNLNFDDYSLSERDDLDIRKSDFDDTVPCDDDADVESLMDGINGYDDYASLDNDDENINVDENEYVNQFPTDPVNPAANLTLPLIPITSPPTLPLTHPNLDLMTT